MSGETRPRVPRPRVTVALLTYNQASWVQAALESVLAQDYAPLEIIVSDDASTDATPQVIEATLAEHRGTHTADVRFVRRPTNLRHRHTPTVAREARGELLVLAHGDDLSFPDRVSELVRLWRSTGAGWVGSNAVQLDAEGTAQGLYLQGRVRVRLGLPELSAGWRGEMLGATGAFEPRLVTDPAFVAPEDLPTPGGWDHILPFRAALSGGGLAWSPTPLVAYRRHAGQNSRSINDWAGGASVWEETLRAHALPVMAHLRTELAHYRSRVSDRPDLAEHAPLLDAAVFTHLDAWARVRSQLRLDGLRPTWLSPAELASVRAGRSATATGLGRADLPPSPVAGRAG